MERWPPWLTLVLISVSTLCQDGKAQFQSALTIDWVKLTLLPNITVERGTNVTLRCEAKISHSYSQLIHTFTFMLGSNVIYSKNSSEAVVERSLAPARASNSGNYKCHVKVRNKHQSSNLQKLTIEGLQIPQLKVQPDVVYEGDEISATCSAPDETGSLYFYFYNNGHVFTEPSSTNSVTITIEVKNRENYLHCKYRHMMQVNGALSNNSNTVKVIVQDYNITPSIRIQPDINVVEGDRVYVSCNVSGYTQTDLEIFLIHNKLLHSNSASFTHSFEAKVEDSGKYVCKAEIRKVQRISTDELIVAELFSMPVLSMTPEQVFEGQSFSLNCWSSIISQQRINRTDVKYTLNKNQHPLKTERIFNFTATQAMNGNFTCTAEAKGIQKTSKQLIINVKVPVSTPVIRTVGKVIVKQPFQILCESTLGTLPITYTLLKSQSQLFQTNTIGPLRTALFNITSISQKDEIHSFKCRAENGAENSELSQALTSAVIEPVSKPKLTLSPEDHVVTEGKNVTIFCSVKEGTVPVTFSWYRKGTTQPLYTARLSRTKGEHFIESSRESRGTYYCEASNDANETKRSDDVSIAVNFAGWKKVVIAVICILILVLIVTILVLFLKKTGAPRKRKRAVELSVKSARPKSNDPMRMSLTLDIEDNTAFNSTPGVMGRNVWSEDVSDSENDDPSREEECEELRYTEMHPQQTVDDEEAPIQESVAVNGEVQDCTQGATDEGASDCAVEYVQLNHGEPDPE